MVTTQRALQMASAGDCDCALADAHKKSRRKAAVDRPLTVAVLLEKGRIEWPRKQILQSMGFGLAARIDQQDFEVAAKFPQNLAARPAGWRECIGVGRDGDPAEGADALRNRFENGDALGAERQAISRVLDIAAGVDAEIGR